MKRFDYLVPNSLEEALSLLSERPEATALAGGTDVLVQLKERHREASALLSLKGIPELHTLRSEEGLQIGAAVTLQHVAGDPLIRRDYKALATAAGLIGSVQTRNMATIGGNICNASPSADTAPPLLALGAQVVLTNVRETRTIALHEFFLGPGETALQTGELLKEIVIPAQPARAGSAYVRHILRQAMDISVVGVAVALVLNGAGQIAGARIALGAVAPVPMLANRAADLLIGHNPSEHLWAEAGSMAAREARPVDDLRASVAYRRHLVEELTQDALRAAINNVTERQEG